MTDTSTTLRALLIYALVLPLALMLGYQLATPQDFSTMATVGLVCSVICVPLLLKWNRALLFMSWNLTALVFFLPGHPELWLVVAFVSLGFAIVQRTLVRDMRFIHVPSLTLPIVFLTVVVLVTGRLTGSFGLRIFGSAVIGAKNYFYILGAAAGFFAMTAQRIPPHKALLFVGLFFLVPLTNLIGSLAPIMPTQLYFLFWFFPVFTGDVGSLSANAGTGFDEHITRFASATSAAVCFIAYLLARYGIRELLTRKNFWRLLLLIVAMLAGVLSGFRSNFLYVALVFLAVFYFEGLFRTKFALPFLAACLLGSVLVVSFANKMPLGLQRALSILPLDVDPVARTDAERSTEFRVGMWKVLIPEIPKYFWLGKGVGISLNDADFTADMIRRGAMTEQDQAMLAGNYHSGPFSLLITFGIWGAIGWIWFMIASIRALYLNYRYGEDYLKKINTFLLASYLVHTFTFFAVVGDFRIDFAMFAGLVGLSVALNNGIRRPVRTVVDARPIPIRVRRALQPAPESPA